ncbi:MAG: MFS transporter [Rhodoferax sp.]
MQPTSSEKRTVLLLAASQALFQTASVMVMTISGLVGQQLATDKRLATLPIAMMMVAAAATMIPASLLMQRLGRKIGFLLGTVLGCAAGLLAAAGVVMHHFGLFVLANMLVGAYQGFAQYYRFAAADSASADFRSRAISWVVAGGVVAALAGPNLARVTQGLGSAPFAASYLALFATSVLAMLVVSRITLAPPALVHAQGPARPLLEIMRQPVFLTALAASSVGYGVMVMVMTATPLAMQMCGQSLGSSTQVIQWHVLGMFVPSFFTGNLIHRHGVLRIMGVGITLLAGHVAIALSGIEFLHFLSGLILLGVGWNFLFVGGTTLLTQAYRPAERAQTQAAHDFLMFAVVSLASFSAGGLLNTGGWESVNLTALPFLTLAAGMVGWLAVLRRHPTPRTAEAG